MTPQGKIALGAALEFTRAQFGGDVTINESNPTIGTSVGNVVLANGDRVALLIVNVGANNLYIATNSQVSSTNGIELSPAGGAAGFTVRDDWTLPSLLWFGITTVGNTSVYVLEVVRINRAGVGTPS